MKIKPSLLREIDVGVRLAIGTGVESIKYEVQDAGATLYVEVVPNEGADVGAMAKSVADILARYLPPIPDEYAWSVVFERGAQVLKTVLSPMK